MLLRRLNHHLPAILAALFAVLTSVLAASRTLGFADDAEFALVTWLGSIAHGPGFPAYTLLGTAIGNIGQFTGLDHLILLVGFSIASHAAAVFFLSKSINILLPENRWTGMLIACGYAVGITTWIWSNAVEVYALQSFAVSLSMYGVIRFRQAPKTSHLIFAAIAFALGLSNHHLTMGLWGPFALILLWKPLTDTGTNRWKVLGIAAAAGLVVLVSCYGWMYWRAQGVYPFEFGNPDNGARFLRHITGGAWTAQAVAEINGIARLRLPYFLDLVFRQWLVMLPFLLWGIVVLWRKKAWLWLLVSLGYLLLILGIQIRTYQFADTDSYLIGPFVVAALLGAFGLEDLIKRFGQKVLIVASVTVLINTGLNFPLANKRNYPVSDTLMMELDRSAPQGSVVMISEWSSVMQYYYYRIAEGFRPDLVVIKDNIKFTNAASLQAMYPDFYAGIKPEYQAYLNEMRATHPEQIFDTGGDFDTEGLVEAYRALLYTIIRKTAAEDRPFMRDAGIYLFHAKNGLTTYDAFLSGPFFTTEDKEPSWAFLQNP
ncbi:MAG: DUF2723 domain-containing protein, partial [Bacteroidia bacterium]